MADLDLAVDGSSRDSSGPRVVMIPERRRPRQTRTSTMLAGVESSSLMTHDRVGSTKSLWAMRARAWSAQHWTRGLAWSWARASRMLTLVWRCWELPRLPTYL